MSEMKILVLSDIHGQRITLEKILRRVKVLPLFACFIAGDITNHGTQEELINTLKIIRAFVPRIFFVLGNCDPVLNLDSKREELSALNIYWLKSPIDMGDFLLVGFNGTRINPFKIEINEKYKHKKVCILTHIPPYGTLADSVSPIRHIGSRELRTFIEKHHEVFLNVCGHVHEAPSISKLGEATIINPGPVTLGHYAVITVTKTFDMIGELRTIYD